MSSDDLVTHVAVSKDGELVQVHDPGSTGHVIEKMHAILSVDADGEGIAGFLSPQGNIPMIAADLRVAEKMLPLAQQMSTVTQRQFVLVEFSTRTILKTIEPE